MVYYLQIHRITDDGMRFKQLYHIDSYPYIAVIDPRTGNVCCTPVYTRRRTCTYTILNHTYIITVLLEQNLWLFTCILGVNHEFCMFQASRVNHFVTSDQLTAMPPL